MRRPYSVLLPVGFTVPPAVAGGAVGSYSTLSLSPARRFGDLLSVALSLGSPPPGITRHRGFRGARTFLAAFLRKRRGRPILWRSLSSASALAVQEQLQQDRAALALDLAVHLLGAEAPLESGDRIPCA
jgi:hypothetical protein